jgi:hypothetical protein
LKRVESENGAFEANSSGSINGERTTAKRAVQSAPGKQHKVTWRDDVVGMGDVGPGADKAEDGGDEESEGDDEDDEALKDIYGSDT